MKGMWFWWSTARKSEQTGSLVLSTKFSKEETIEFESQKVRLVVQLLFVQCTTSCRWRFHRFVFSHDLLEVILNCLKKKMILEPIF